LNSVRQIAADISIWLLQTSTKPSFWQQYNFGSNFKLFLKLHSTFFNFHQGSGYYTKEQYRKILQEAAARHVEVIPEIDAPGHSRAAIKAMEARYVFSKLVPVPGTSLKWDAFRFRGKNMN